MNTNGRVEARRRQQKATDQAGYWVRSRRQRAALGVCLRGTPSIQIGIMRAGGVEWVGEGGRGWWDVSHFFGLIRV